MHRPGYQGNRGYSVWSIWGGSCGNADIADGGGFDVDGSAELT